MLKEHQRIRNLNITELSPAGNTDFLGRGPCIADQIVSMLQSIKANQLGHSLERIEMQFKEEKPEKQGTSLNQRTVSG